MKRFLEIPQKFLKALQVFKDSKNSKDPSKHYHKKFKKWCVNTAGISRGIYLPLPHPCTPSPCMIIIMAVAMYSAVYVATLCLTCLLFLLFYVRSSFTYSSWLFVHRASPCVFCHCTTSCMFSLLMHGHARGYGLGWATVLTILVFLVCLICSASCIGVYGGWYGVHYNSGISPL